MDDISIGDWTIKKAPFDQTLFLDKNAPKPLSGQALADSLRKAEEERPKAKTDSTPQSILLIGDSMTWNIALRMAQYAKQNGHQFHAINWDSSSTTTWAKSDTLQHFIEKYDVTYVFISLGSNELYLAKPESHRKYVEEIIEKVGDRPYVWIGPPNWMEDAGVNDMIQSACAPGSFFRSAGMSFERKKDKIHPTKKASALWVDSIARWLPSSSHPILMSAPPDTMPSVNANMTFLKALNK
ncbi:MAG: SGNH/GDSL hydrolase family protein [Clostridium sp.]|nr:SGNH/GDSL hydrolase family protein [Prevotella sp.]MCM1428177.1 SGNH/GDSL hydrolase family protein [Clostridium sp.]MCM1475908.1 SGNH/GDSL hydrolase family protein [Muribaculaceae bacterium]